MRGRPPSQAKPGARTIRALSCTCAFALATWSLGARARTQETYAYDYARVWPTAVRLIRIDLGCKITEKDRDNGYLMFEYPQAGKQHPGSLELVAIDLKGRPGTQVIAQVPAMPAYVERMILTRLGKKLAEEHGDPPAPRPPKDPPSPPDDAPDEAPEPDPEVAAERGTRGARRADAPVSPAPPGALRGS